MTARRVYAPDMRGHGKSSWTPGGYHMEGFADDIEAFVSGVVGESVVLCGHSLGGQVAVQTAARRPDLVLGLVIGDAPFDRARAKAALAGERARIEMWRDLARPGLPVDEIRGRLLNMPIAGSEGPVPARQVFGEDSSWFDFMAQTLSEHDPAMLDAVIEFDRMHAAYDYERLLPRIECPTLIIQADPVLGGMSDEEVERGLALIRDGGAVKLKGIGHPLFYPDPAPALRAIVDVPCHLGWVSCTACGRCVRHPGDYLFLCFVMPSRHTCWMMLGVPAVVVTPITLRMNRSLASCASMLAARSARPSPS